MILTEYDETKVLERTYRDGKEEGLKQGLEQGLQKGRINMLLDLVRDETLTPRQAAAKAGITEADFRALLDQQDQ